MPRTEWVALFRGMNVGGKNRISMSELARQLEKFGLEQVKTYIQSGNVVFTTDGNPDGSGLSEKIHQSLLETCDLDCPVFLSRAQDWMRVLDNNPYAASGHDPKSVHFYFLSSIPSSPDFQKLEDIRKPTEHFQWVGDVFYLYAPEGIGRSKLAARIESALGVNTTARNLRTVNQIQNLLGN